MAPIDLLRRRLIFHQRRNGVHGIMRTMEYRGVMYDIRARPGRDEWTWTIYPNDGRARSNQFTGTRDEAIATACWKIDFWLTEQNKRAASKNQSKLT